MTEGIEPTENKVLAIQEPTDVMSMMVKAAEHMDVDKLEKLMDLQERMLNRNAKSEFAADFVRMKPLLPKIIRTKDNTQTQSKYAPLEDINKQIDPILEQHGFGTATKIVSQTEKTVTVRAELWHKGGHVEETIITMPLDEMGIKGTVNKTGPHATASSVTYAKRVAICALLNISTGDDKDGNAVERPIEGDFVAEIEKLLEESGADKERFLKFMGVESIGEIKQKDYHKAKSSIKAKKRDAEKKATAA